MKPITQHAPQTYQQPDRYVAYFHRVNQSWHEAYASLESATQAFRRLAKERGMFSVRLVERIYMDGKLNELEISSWEAAHV